MKEISLPRIYPITDRRLSGLSHHEQCAKLISIGATLIQIREKDLTSDLLFDDLKKCVALGREHGVKILINDRVDIALACDSDGVHLGQTDMGVADARRLLGRDKTIGVSTHNRAEVNEALAADADYIAIGPVFGTTTKENPDPTLEIEGFKELRRMIPDRPVVAIGGVNSENYRDVLIGGADSVAVIGALYSSDGSIESNFRRFTD